MLSVRIAASSAARWQLHPEMRGVVLHGGTLQTCALRLDGQGPGGPWGSGCFVGQCDVSGEALTLSLDILISEMGIRVPFWTCEEQ